jgi:hypothetical protein
MRLAARSFVVESIYSGLEQTLKTIADEVDDRPPSGRDWHAVLLKAMAASGPLGRPPVIGPVTFRLLDDLRRFRHVSRHRYALELDEEGVGQNLAAVRRVLPLFEADMRAFETAMDREEAP